MFLRTLSIVLGFLSILLTALLGIHFYLNVNTVTMTEAAPLQDDSTRTAPEVQKIQQKEPFIVALLGTDAEQQENVSRTDTIMLIRYDMNEKKATIVSIPRDSYVDIEGHGTDKINAAHAYGGTDLALSTIEDVMGIHIDYYAKANFKGFMEVTETLGGVKVNPLKTISYKGVTIHPGEQTLSGNELLTYVRFRKDADGDFGRINRQQEVIISATKEMVKPSNLLKIPEFVEIIRNHVKSNLNWQELMALAKEATNYEDIEIEQHTLKTQSQKMNGIWYELIDESNLEEMSNLLKGEDPFVEESETSEDGAFSTGDFSSETGN